MTCYRSYRSLAATQVVPENSSERLSVSESISKRWTTLKTEVVGGPSNRRDVGGSLSKYNGDKRDREQQ